MYICRTKNKQIMWREIGAALGAMVIMFWNVENYFDPFEDPLKNDDEFTARAQRHWTWPRFEQKRDGIAQTVVAVGDITGELPALVGLAEVENRMVVSQLVHKTMLADLEYGFVHRESPDERGIDVALLYRRDLLQVETVDSLRIPGFVTRDILYVRFKTLSNAGHKCHPRPDRGSLHVLVVHLPSKRGGARNSDARRETALGVLQHTVDSLLVDDPSAQIVVMGDFNDTAPSVSGLSAPQRATPDAALQDVPGTLRYHGRWEQIDHFLLSEAINAKDTTNEAPKMIIFAHPFLLEPDKAWLGVKPRRTYIGPRHNGGLSDHLPIVLVF